MALSETVPTSYVTNGDQTQPIVKYNTDLGLLAYVDLDVSALIGRVVDISGGSIALGATNQINDGATAIEPGLDAISTSQVIMLYGDATDGWLRILNISGTTITEQTAANIATKDYRRNNVAMLTTTLGIAAMADVGGGTPDLEYCRFTVSGNTVTPGSATESDDANATTPVGLVKIDSTKALCVYYTATQTKAVVLDCSSGITQGTASVLWGSGVGTSRSGKHILVRVDTNKFFFMSVDATPSPDLLKGVIITTSGTSIDTVGTPLTIASGNSVAAGGAVATTTAEILITYNDNTGQTKIETLAVSGTTLTSNADTINTTHDFADSLATGLDLLDSGQAVFPRLNAGAEGKISLITGFSSPTASGARFYFGQGVLAEQFTLPFAQVSPRAMTLDKSLGTVVIGAFNNSNEPIVYSNYPYPTGTATFTGFPTGIAISTLKWI